MTATVNFENPQVQVGDGMVGIEISPIIIPYSIRNTEDPLQYLGGQVVLTKEDNVAFSDNTTDWYKKALVKIKNMVADTEIYGSDLIIAVPEELPASSAAEAPVSSAEAPVSSVAPVSSAAPAISASTVASSAVEAPVSSASVVASSASAQVTTTPSESTTEA